MPMSQAEAGKLGTIKARSIISAKKKQRIEEYEKDPILCLTCQTAITYENKIKKNKFCNHKCAAEFTNSCRGRKRKSRNCSVCHCSWTPVKNASRIRCENCIHKTHPKDREKIPLNELKTSGPRRRRLIEIQGQKCSICLLTEWQGKPIPVEVDHIDGDSENNTEQNLRLLCPNCHAQTDTYKGKNRGKGRHARMQRYYEGKSY